MIFPWGRRFTRFNREGTKLSKLDRFLVSNQFFNIWRDAKAKALVREVSDHCPIVLFDVSVDFGPKRFKLFNHWMENESFSKVVENSWKCGDFLGSADIVLKNKIKKLKADIKTWCHGFHEENESKKKDILSRLADWDVKAESGSLTSFDHLKRDEDLMDLQLIDQKDRDALKQKSRIKWAIEGDENSKFFHSLVKKKTRRQNINGLKVNGCWVEDPISIFSAAYDHFSNRFRESIPHRPKFRSLLFKRLDREYVALLESPFSMDEVKAMVWDCSSLKPLVLMV